MSQVKLEIGKYYHIFNRRNNKELIFLNEDNYNYFLSLVSKYLLPISDMYSYCLIPNHFHFVIKIKTENELPQGFDVSKLHQPFSNLFNAYSKAFNKRNNRRGSLFQEHLKRIEIKNSDYLRNLIVDVNTNSNHHELGDYKIYKHCSFLSLISDNETKLARKQVVDLFDDVKNLKFMFESKKEKLDTIKEFTFE